RAALLAVVVLAGCAAPAAYREGQELVAQGRVTEGLALLEEASRLEPAKAEYRVAVVQTRERYVNALIDRAEALRRQGKLQEAEQVFRQVLAVHG
ncbi:tetratricopeptide repeat protein, partial [Clostridium perfringens]|uniref:tetratricopeptide repeat protein n=1 Tax=Clostridium perfringens TaxID=1502 RepID=UPI0018E46BA0